MQYLIFIFLIPIITSTLFKSISHICTWKYFETSHNPETLSYPTVSIIVPIRGVDQYAAENYKSYFSQKYAGNYDVIFALEEDDDPAISVINNLITELNIQNARITLSKGAKGHGKLKNQIAGIKASKNQVYVLVDSDVRLSLGFLNKNISSVASNQVGLTFAAPAAIGSKNLFAALHNMIVCASILTSGLIAYKEKISSAVGSCMIIRKDVVQAIGGLEAISDRVVGVDVALGRAVSEKGYELKLLPEPAIINHQNDSFRRLWWQIHRWYTTIRGFYPTLPAIILITSSPVLWSLLFLAVSAIIKSYITFGILLVTFALLVDVISAAVINAKLVHDKHLWPYIFMAPIVEVFTFPILIQSIFSNKVLWRGRWLSVNDKVSRTNA